MDVGYSQPQKSCGSDRLWRKRMSPGDTLSEVAVSKKTSDVLLTSQSRKSFTTGLSLRQMFQLHVCDDASSLMRWTGCSGATVRKRSCNQRARHRCAAVGQTPSRISAAIGTEEARRSGRDHRRYPADLGGRKQEHRTETGAYSILRRLPDVGSAISGRFITRSSWWWVKDRSGEGGTQRRVLKVVNPGCEKSRQAQIAE